MGSCEAHAWGGAIMPEPRSWTCPTIITTRRVIAQVRPGQAMRRALITPRNLWVLRQTALVDTDRDRLGALAAARSAADPRADRFPGLLAACGLRRGDDRARAAERAARRGVRGRVVDRDR